MACVNLVLSCAVGLMQDASTASPDSPNPSISLFWSSSVRNLCSIWLHIESPRCLEILIRTIIHTPYIQASSPLARLLYDPYLILQKEL